MAASNSRGTDGEWWAEKWIALLDELGVDAQRRTRSALRRVHVQRLEILAGSVSARVVDKDLGTCDVEIRLRQLDAEQWQAVIDALSEQALFAAQLLAGDLQPEIQQLFLESGRGLLPENALELTYVCSLCSDPHPADCRPLIAVHLSVAEMLNENPGLLFRLRGRERQEMINSLRMLRNRSAAATRDRERPEQPITAEQPVVYRAGPPLDSPDGDSLLDQRDSFWGNSKALREFHHHISAPNVELAVMRRLGPLPYSGDSMAAYDLLTDTYGRVTDAALAMAYASEPEEDEDESLDE